MTKNALQKIEELQAEIANLKEEAVNELKAKIIDARKALAEMEHELETLTGKPLATKSRDRSTGKSVPLTELKEMLFNAPNKTLGIRREGLNLANIKTLANANPTLLKIEGKSPWFTVRLLK